MSKVQRIYPESKTAVINYIEENFHEIDEFVCTFRFKDGTSITIYDAYTYFNALVMIEMGREAIQEAVRNDTFVQKGDDE
jgi:hypothetical protein